MSTPIRPGTDSGASYTPDAAMPPKPEKSSLFEDFIDIFHAPSTVFARRASSGFWMPLLVVSLIAGVFAFANRSVNSQIFDVEFDRGAASAMAKNPQITPEMMATQRSISTKIASFMGYIGTPIALFVLGLFAWLAAKVVKAKISYEQAVVILTFAWIPRLVQGLLVTIQALLMDTSQITSMHSLGASPARFMDPETTSRSTMAIVGRFDVFTIWVTVLIGIGIAVMGKVDRTKGYIAAGLLFVLGTLFMMLTTGG